ncbi:MAG TPA: hypothetical protein VGK24_18875 [Candidatus Angelobacter sp.]|jgi:hypothetical protein
MKNTLLLSFGLFLLVSNGFGQTPASASTEPNRILGARMDVAYSEDKTGVSVRVTNISDKVIDWIYISSGSDNGARSMSILGNIKPGGTSMLGMGTNGRLSINLEAIVYADGSMEARNDAAIAEVKEHFKVREFMAAHHLSDTPDVRKAPYLLPDCGILALSKLPNCRTNNHKACISFW